MLLPFDLVLSALFATPALAACSSYLIIGARGTGDPVGPAYAWRATSSNVLSQVKGGTLYNVNYPASQNQDFGSGVTDLVNKVSSTLANNPRECIVLIGYSQGSALISEALSKLSGDSFSAVKAVVLLANPSHKKGLACDKDENGGYTTANHDGVEAWQGMTVPGSWVSKTLDICYTGDQVCCSPDDNAEHKGYPYGLTNIHGRYGGDSGVQHMATSFLVGALT